MAKYIVLLRGINAGKTRRVAMKELRTLCEQLGCSNVSTYLNSGNVIFDSSKKPNSEMIEKELRRVFGFDIRTLIKPQREIQRIAEAIPKDWKNDTEQRTDIAYLFPEIDSKLTVAKLPMDPAYIDIRYVPGAILWRVLRKDYNKSHLNKLISNKLYQSMTVRNVNTARAISAL